MEFSGISIVEHASVSMDEVWLIHKNDAPQVPEELRANLLTPCILTGDAALARNLLALASAIDGSPVTGP